jgi:hypothetical protein
VTVWAWHEAMVVARELSELGTEGLDATMRKRRR